MNCLEGCPVSIFWASEFSQADAQVHGRRKQHIILTLVSTYHLLFSTSHIMIHHHLCTLKKATCLTSISQLPVTRYKTYTILWVWLAIILRAFLYSWHTFSSLSLQHPLEPNSVILKVEAAHPLKCYNKLIILHGVWTQTTPSFE